MPDTAKGVSHYKMARGNSMGNRRPHFVVGVSFHPADSLYGSVHLAGDESGAGLAPARAR